ncbi:EamA family transporter [Sporanaerobium hydrogeniformans]|uniref:EamA family transporter n=1 Tax=Sporanaerobium hydrogeniformans TaxID=3072179 RepID=A0AC61DD50_9FIRM|nr:DMT family transporter [Sporanaerobium hydrogeniformans]PHV71224.1 EamA family transporter [Sporanaerobium hydrogeniformans]
MKETKKIPAWVGDLMLFITALVWGGGFIGVKESLNTLSPFYMIAARFAIASILLVLIFWKKLGGFTKEEIKYGSIIGLFLFLGFGFQTVGAIHLEMSKLAFLTALNVIMVPFLVRVVFKEPIKKYNLIASFIAVLGFIFLNFNAATGLTIGYGEVLGILCAIAFAAQITSTGHFAKKVDPIRLTVIQMVVCCLLGFMIAIPFEPIPQAVSKQMLIPVLYLGVFSTCIAFLFQTVGQKYTSAPRAAIILCMESVFGTLFAVLFFKEVITVYTVIGAILIMAGVILSEYMHARGESR